MEQGLFYNDNAVLVKGNKVLLLKQLVMHLTEMIWIIPAASKMYYISFIVSYQDDDLLFLDKYSNKSFKDVSLVPETSYWPS